MRWLDVDLKRNMMVALALLLSVGAVAQMPSASCPVNPVHFDPAYLSVKVQNVSGKMIVGMTWFAAIADATEHWNWIYWDLPGPSRLREFNWNQEVKAGAKKTLSWTYDLDYRNASGGTLILGSVLFSDGSRWQESPAQHSCQAVWLNHNKRAFTRPEDLPRF